MKYINTIDFPHDGPRRIGVLLTNLGTPTAPEAAALRPYLKQFLSDPRVVEVPRLLWWFILNGVILNLRPKRSAAAYRKVWTQQGSPLLIHTRDQAEALRVNLQADYGDHVLVDFAMRYGEPSIASKVQMMVEHGVNRLLLLPLYPQYSAPTTASTFDALAEDFRRRRWLPDLRFVSHYHDHPDYIAALANSIRRHWDQHGRTEKLIFSYHGEPLSYLEKGDPYHCECYKTSRLVAESLELDESEYLTTFQSRFGREPWLQPYTDETLKGLAGDGVKSVQVLCPGFSADCLETLEEIDEENRDYFLSAGGERFDYIPCLNSDPEHIKALGKIVRDNLQGWPKDSSDAEARKTRADTLASKGEE